MKLVNQFPAQTGAIAPSDWKRTLQKIKNARVGQKRAKTDVDRCRNEMDKHPAVRINPDHHIHNTAQETQFCLYFLSKPHLMRQIRENFWMQHPTQRTQQLLTWTKPLSSPKKNAAEPDELMAEVRQKSKSRSRIAEAQAVMQVIRSSLRLVDAARTALANELRVYSDPKEDIVT